MKTVSTFELLYNWVTADGMNDAAECLELLDDPIGINRDLEHALQSRSFNGCSPMECLELLQSSVRDQLLEDAEAQECNAKFFAEREFFSQKASFEDGAQA